MATIDIRIQRIDHLIDSLDPSPFSENEKALSRDAEDYIVDFAGEYGRAEPLRLIVQAPVSIKPHAAEIAYVIHAHFERAHVQCRRRYQRRMRIGRTLLVAGIAVLGNALLLRALLGDPGGAAGTDAGVAAEAAAGGLGSAATDVDGGVLGGAWPPFPPPAEAAGVGASTGFGVVLPLLAT
ncbi:MAG: hypothetical protein IDH49_04550 [Gammaproteobacteria bacterium]|nr:hypothetical protein [Gammaproteobacteria bacterium]